MTTEYQDRYLQAATLEVNPAILPPADGPSNTQFAFTGTDRSRDSVEVEKDRFGSYPLGGWSKRFLDITLALTLLFLLAPLMLTVALLISLTSGGDVIFSQQRIGARGRSFSCLKFRTMVPDAEGVLKKYLQNNPEADREWSERQKLQFDPRIIWFGQLLRRSSIDELPQLINVLRGEMSLIGPRPIVASELVRYGALARDYLAARPGLTGMWQVNGRNRRTYQERVALDRYYVRRWSIWVDLWILLNTIPAVLRFDDAS